MNAAGNQAVFLSYASQDAEPARRICEALRAAGLEVWFDLNELRGGDAWDQKIRRQIKACALFVPVISANTDARPEGYFRLEWLLAVERARLMADDHPFLFPIAIGDVNEAKARVPEKFREVQWTRVRLDETPAELAARVARLLTGGTAAGSGRETAGAQPAERRAEGAAGGALRWWWMIFPVIGTLMGLAWATKVFWSPRPEAGGAKPAGAAAVSAPSEVQQLIARAWSLLNKPELSRLELETAEELCRRAAALDPTDADAQAAWSQVDSWMLYQHIDLSTARLASARSKAARALQLAPQSYEARLAHACFLVRGRGDRGKPDNVAETEAALRALLAERPEEPRALLALGILLRNVDRKDEARATFETLARNPGFAALGWNEVGWLLFGAGEMAAAVKAVELSIAAQPYWANLMLKSWLAEIWFGDLDAMKTTFERIPESFRRSEQGLNYALTVHYSRRDAAACLRILDEISGEWMEGWNHGPKAAWAMLAHRAAGGRDEARRLAGEAALRTIGQRLTTKPGDWQVLEWKGFVLAELGQAEAAAQAYRQARESQPEPDWLFELREALALRRTVRAIELLEAAVARGPAPYVTAATLRLHPWHDGLRAHPRFQALQAKLDADPRFTPTPKRTAAVEVKAPLSPARQLLEKAWVQLNTQELGRAELETADTLCKRAAELDPVDAEVWATWTHVHAWFLYHAFDAGAARKQAVRDCAEKAMRLEPESFEVRLAQAIYRVRGGGGGNREGNADLLRGLLKERPDEPRCLLLLGRLLMARKETHEEGLAALERLAQNPKFTALAWVEIGWSWHNHDQDMRRALEAANRSIAAKPFWHNLGLKAQIVAAWVGDLETAHALARQIPLAAQKEDWAATVIDRIAYLRRSHDERIRFLNSLPQEWLSSHQFHGPKAALLGEARLQSGATELAKRDLTRAIALIDERLKEQPNNGRLLGLKAVCLWGVGEKAAARENYDLHRQLENRWWRQPVVIFESTESVLDLLEKNPPFRAMLALDPGFDPFRQHPRFIALLEKTKHDPALSPHAPEPPAGGGR